MNKEEQLVLSIFTEISVPFLAIDFQKLKRSFEHGVETKSYIAIPISKDEELFIQALRGIIKQYDVPSYLYTILFKTKLSPKDNFTRKITSSDNFFTLQMNKNNLVWEESSLWPLIYSTFINQLVNLTKNFKHMIELRKKEIKNTTQTDSVMLVSEYNKNMPTEIHSAFASLGSFIGGSNNFEYLAKYATKYQIYNSGKNIEYAKKIKYSDNETKDLDKSGMIALPASVAIPLLELSKSQNILGSIPIDEMNIANLPIDSDFSLFNRKKEDIKHPGFIMDKYYRSIFSGLELNKEYAVYGKDNVMRDHYTDFYNSLNNYEFFRCKHYCMPIIDVNNVDEMKALISKIPKRSESGVFFRGQTSFYELQREDSVQKILFGDSESKEPSLVTSASRANYNYDHLHFILKYFLEHEIVFKEYDDKKIKKNIFKKLEELNKSFLLKLDYAVMALAQHYGLPTHGLDVTTDLDVAVWFATNKFKMESDKATYTKMDTNEWNEDKSKWPIVFVFQNVLASTSSSLQDCVELEEIGLKALRPQRQSAKFFHAAHSDHQNRLAESLVCAFRLCPNNYDTKADFKYLFPSPEEDEAYKFMLNFADNEMLSMLKIPREKITNFH